MNYIKALGPHLEENHHCFSKYISSGQKLPRCALSVTLPMLLDTVTVDTLLLNALFLSISQEPTVKLQEFCEPVVKVIIKM